MLQEILYQSIRLTNQQFGHVFSHMTTDTRASCREPQVMQFKHCYESQRE